MIESNLGSYGNIKSINNIVFTYANNNSWNNRSGVTGKLTKIEYYYYLSHRLRMN